MKYLDPDRLDAEAASAQAWEPDPDFFDVEDRELSEYEEEKAEEYHAEWCAERWYIEREIESCTAELHRLARVPFHRSMLLRSQVEALWGREDGTPVGLFDRLAELANAVRDQHPELLVEVARLNRAALAHAKRLNAILPDRRTTESPRRTQWTLQRATLQIVRARPEMNQGTRRRGAAVGASRRPPSRPHRRGSRERRGARTSARSRGDGHACASSGRWAVPDSLPA